MSRKNVSILFLGIPDLSGGGGAERFFIGFFADYQKNNGAEYKLSFLTDTPSLKNLSSVIDLKGLKDIYCIQPIHNRFKEQLEFLQISWLILKHRIKLIQLPLYGVQYYELLARIDKMPKWIRPKIVINITDAYLPYYYLDTQNKPYDFKKIFGKLFETIHIDAMISWYDQFRDFAIKHRIVKSNPEIFVIDSRYTNKQFNTSTPKENMILYAGRLTDAKKPQHFIEAVHLLKQRGLDLSGWKFPMYGKGIMEEELKQKIKTYGLNDQIIISHHADLTSVFERSKCFVSTMDIENFPSLAMNEAMAAGNAIIARNVGRTSLFVKHGKNGLLVEPDNEIGFANAIEYYISHPETHASMSRESIELTKTIHNFPNFKNQMESFWKQILN